MRFVYTDLIVDRLMQSVQNFLINDYKSGISIRFEYYVIIPFVYVIRSSLQIYNAETETQHAESTVHSIVTIGR